jgi:hypothetical protein
MPLMSHGLAAVGERERLDAHWREPDAHRPGQAASPTEYWTARGSKDRMAASVNFFLMIVSLDAVSAR